MYGLPSNLDLSFFVGRELEQVSFTANTVHLMFDGEVAITLESSFFFKSDNSDEGVTQKPPIRTSSVMMLLGRRIHSAKATSEGNLVLEFAEGGTLVCIDDSKAYESYHIRVRGEEISV